MTRIRSTNKTGLPAGKDRNDLTDRLVAAVRDAGVEGLSIEAAQAIGHDRVPATTRTTLGRLSQVGRIVAIGFQGYRRWFAEQADADAWWATTGHKLMAKVRRSQGYAERKAERIARRLAAPKPQGIHRKKWNDAEIETLRAVYPQNGAEVVAKQLGRTVRAVTAKAIKLEISCLVCPHHMNKPPKPAKVKRPREQRLMPARAKSTRAARAIDVTVKKARGPALADGPVTYHPNFKFTVGPSPSLGFRTNTHAT